MRILLVDDHTILRQGIAGLLGAAADIEVVAEAGTGEEAVRLARELTPDIIILDVSLPGIDGLEAARRIREQGCNARIIFLTMHNDTGVYTAAFRAGAHGYLLKDDALVDLLRAIAAVQQGERFISGSLRVESRECASPLPKSVLTRRESEILSLIAAGFTSKEIAAKLYISLKTVEAHRSRIISKLGAKNIAEVVSCAIKTGLVD